MVLLSGVLCAFGMAYLSSRMGALPVFKRLVLRPPDAAVEKAPSEVEEELAGIHAELNVGDRGVAQSALRPAGKALFGKRYADVVTDGDFINRGATVEIMQIAGNRVIVREISETA
jgi:membrane-bound serine protease (ClpP class)